MSFKIPNIQLFSNRPPGFYCYICGKEFGSASLRLHVKSCIKQWEAVENTKIPKHRRPTPTPPSELATIYDMMKRGVKIDPKIIDFYNEKAIRLWEEKFCMKCGSCNRMIPHSLKESHKKLCISMPQINSPTESLPEAIVKDFPYEPKTFTSLSKHQQSPRSIQDSISIIESRQAKMINTPPEYVEELTLELCDICDRKYRKERMPTHMRACEIQLRGQWKHDEMMKRAQAKQLANLKFHDFEKRYQTHKWKEQHRQLEEIFVKKPEGDIPVKSFELIHEEFFECSCCNKLFHPKRIQTHQEHCKKIHENLQEKKSKKIFNEDKLNTLSKWMQKSQSESMKSVLRQNKIFGPRSEKASTPTFGSPKAQSNLMQKKPEFIKIKLKEIPNQVDQMNESTSKSSSREISKDVKPKVGSHVQTRKTAGPNFENRTQTSYLKSSDFFAK